jgi:type II secretory pathway component PulM
MTEESLFEQAIQVPPDERAAFLDRECPDPALRARVEAMLAAKAPTVHPHAAPPSRQDEFPATTRVDVKPPLGLSPACQTVLSFSGAYEPVDAHVVVIAGRYKLRRQIGEGGMGSVWLADQTEPIKREVAIKLIRVERGQSGTILARFEAERQAIALMDHPHIAKLLDAGTTETGAPFFVMELVKGIPLNEFCDQHRLTIPERLNLFIQICGAVQHAHQKGIIHRDLKPSNLLVESQDGKPVPKVIDFGLAKATTGLQLTDQSLFTGFGTVLGTPLYMAPEQASLNAIDVDTRADVYALGVILYELLTGTTPITRETLKKAALDEMLRLIREQEAPTPSSRLSSSDNTPSVAANRQMEPAKLGRFVKGELDWIVMKALAKERDRRYETANGFARDIERFLNHEPVQAGPPSAAYRIKKFLRRHRGPVIAASLILLALVVGVIGTTWGFVQATAERDAKEAALQAERRAKAETDTRRQEAEAARQQAQSRLTQIEKSNDIITSIFTDLDIRKIKQGTEPLEAVLAERLVKVAGQLEGEAVGDPLMVAQLQNRLGRSLLSLGHPQAAIGLFEKARATRASHLGADHPDTLTSMANLAEGYRAAGQLDRALPLSEEALKLTQAKLGANHPDTLTSMASLAATYKDAGKLDRALPLLEETVKLMRAKLGADHPDTLASTNNLALGYAAAGKLDRALPLFEETLKLRQARLGADHPATLTSLANLAAGYAAARRLDRAVPLLEEALKLNKAKLGADHPATLASMNNLAAAVAAAGQLDRAIPLLEETLKLNKAKLGADHPDTLANMNNLALGYRAAGQLDRALPLFEETLKRRQAKLGTDHPVTLTSMANLALGYHDAGKLDRVLPLYEEILKLTKAKLGADHPDTLASMSNLAEGYRAAGKLSEAESVLRECLSTREKNEPEAWTTFNTMSLLGGSLLGQKKYADAEPLLLKGYEGMKAREKTIPPQANTRIPESLDRLIELYAATNKPEEAKKWQAERAKYPPAAPMPKAEKKLMPHTRESR